MRRTAPSALLAGALAFTLNGCGENTPQPLRPETHMVSDDVFRAAGTVVLGPGNSVIINAETDPEIRKEFSDAIPLTVSEKPRGFDDKNAPVVGEKPIRVYTDVYAGESYLRNDLACDTINIDLSRFADIARVYVGVLALGTSTNNMVEVNWPRMANEDPASFLQLCFADGNEPRDGVVIVSGELAKETS